MKCRIKRINKDSYFNKHIGTTICPNLWTYIYDAKIFNSVIEARTIIRKCKLKNVEVEYVR